MKAIVVKPGVKDSIHMRDMPDPKLKPDQVAVKMIRAGLCGTDAEISHGLFGQAPEGDEYLILGHENFGVVEEVGKKVKGFKAGDLVVSTVRRPCECYTCKAGQNDMCHAGCVPGARHHGPPRLHGGVLRRVAAVAEQDSEGRRATSACCSSRCRSSRKASITRFFFSSGSSGSRRPDSCSAPAQSGCWRRRSCARAGSTRTSSGREPESDSRAQLAKKMGAKYHSVANKTLFDVQEGDPADRHRHRSDRRARAWRSTACRFSGATACCACSA